MPTVITITGASGSGKSTAIRLFLSQRQSGYAPIQVPKYKTRERRVGEEEHDSVFVDLIPPACDLVYEQYATRYGLESQVLFGHLNNGRSPIVVINDVRTVVDIRQILGPLVTSVFVFRERPTVQDYETLALQRGERDRDGILNRYNKAHATYRIFIENIHLFDRVLLNNWGKDDLQLQIAGIIQSFSDGPTWPLKRSE